MELLTATECWPQYACPPENSTLNQFKSHYNNLGYQNILQKNYILVLYYIKEYLKSTHSLI